MTMISVPVAAPPVPVIVIVPGPAAVISALSLSYMP